MTHQHSNLISFLLVLSFTFGHSYSYGCEESKEFEESGDFEEICELFEETIHMQVDNITLGNYIREGIRMRVNSKDLKEALSMINHLPPEERYKVFKEGAEEILGREWNCEPMKSVLTAP